MSVKTQRPHNKHAIHENSRNIPRWIIKDAEIYYTYRQTRAARFYESIQIG